MALAEQALAQFPDNLEIKVAKALLLNLSGRDKECMELVRSMGDMAAVMVTPVLDMGDCLARANRHAEAAKCYRSVRNNLESLKSSSLAAYYRRAVAGEVSELLAQGKQDKALQVLDVVGDSNLTQSDLWTLKAGIYGRKPGCVTRVLQISETRLGVVPEDAVAHWYKASALTELGRYKDALAALERVIQLDGKETPGSLELKAKICAGMGRFEEAIEFVAREVELRSKQEEKIDLSAVGLIMRWKRKCRPAPLVGLELVAALLGVYCGPHRNARKAGAILRLLDRLDRNQLQLHSEADDPAAKLAWEIIGRAENILRVRAKRPCDSSAREIPAQREGEPFLVSALRQIFEAEWPRSVRRPRRRKEKHKKTSKRAAR
jgi:tetratricopeptide (TPR) repeat protein